MVKIMEVVNNLLDYEKLKIVQNTDWFKFSLDSVLLADFINVKKKDRNIIDFCTGNAPIPLFLSTKTSNSIIGVELQEEVFKLAKKSVILNNLENQIEIINEDVKNLKNKYETDTFDIISCNPPYFKISEQTQKNENNIKAIARHEIHLNLTDIFEISRKLLKNNGSIYIVHRTDRLVEIINEMSCYNIMPKRIRFIYPFKNSESNMVLIEGRKNGNSGLKVEKPLVVHDKRGNYTEEINQIFRGRK